MPGRSSGWLTTIAEPILGSAMNTVVTRPAGSGGENASLARAGAFLKRPHGGSNRGEFTKCPNRQPAPYRVDPAAASI